MLDWKEVVGIAVACAVACFLLGSGTVMLLLRHKHKNAMSGRNPKRLSGVPRARLSVSDGSYEEVPQPRTALRRSIQLPYDTSDDWDASGSKEQLPPIEPASMLSHSDRPSPNKRVRHIRDSFSGHSLLVPRTRRSRKIEKTIRLSSMPRSPLSAITEISNSTSDASPHTAGAELPTNMTPKRATPVIEEEESGAVKRPVSTAWPLPVQKRRSANVTDDMQFTMAGVDIPELNLPVEGQRPSPLFSRPALSHRSVSLSSQASGDAPEEPLPPLPSIAPTGRWPTRGDSKLRFSTTSTETASSSVLNHGRSPVPSATEFSAVNLMSPAITFDSHGSRTYEPRDRWEPSAVTLGSPPGKQTMRSFRHGQTSRGSVRGSIGSQPLYRNTNSRGTLGPARDSLRSYRETFSTSSSGQSNGAPAVAHRRNSLSLNGSTDALLARSSLDDSDFTPGPAVVDTSRQRHSMFERPSGADPFATVLRDVSGNQPSPMRGTMPTRPASVPNANVFQWDCQSLQTGRSAAMKAPIVSGKGHKRQNCVRISNLPNPAANSKNVQLPLMAEEPEDQPDGPPKDGPEIPGLGLSKPNNGGLLTAVQFSPLRSPPPFPTSRASPSPSPLAGKGRPRDSLTPRKGRPVPLRHTQDSSSSEDVFKSRYDPTRPNIFASAAEMQWPLPPTPQSPFKPQATLEPGSQPYDPESPALPSPNTSSGKLFSRPFRSKSGRAQVLGPRTPPSSTPSKMQNRINPTPNLTRPEPVKPSTRPEPVKAVMRPESRRTSVRPEPMTKSIRPDATQDLTRPEPILNPTHRRGQPERTSVAPDDLRRSVMQLRRMNSDGKDRQSRNYRSLGPHSELSSPSLTSLTTSPSAGTVPSRRGHNASTLSLSLSQPSLHNVYNDPDLHLDFLPPVSPSFVTDAMKSPSIMSMGAQSIWEDASVNGDDESIQRSPSPSIRSTPTPYEHANQQDVEGFETFMRYDNDRIAAYEKKFLTPRGKEVGLGVNFGRPPRTGGSLYDQEGFLKD